mgnify:CR=1 FL=1
MKNGIDMKRIYAAIVFFMCSASLTTMSGCSGDEGPAGPEPPVIEDYVITPINGGGIATYSIPDSEEVMYVMAEYERNGKKCVERSSVYSNTIRMEGFATTDPVTVAFYTVSRNGVRSEPVVKTFEPLTAPLYLVRQTLSMVTDFGGVSVFWENRFNTEVGVAFLVKDENGEGVMKEWWNVTEEDQKAIMKATTWNAADNGYFRGGGFSSRFETRATMPATMIRLNLVKGLGPVLQIAEGWTVELPEAVSDTLWKRTDYTWPCTWFVPRCDGKDGAFKSAYDVMNNWGANHGAISYGHIGADLITMCSMLRIPVCMHNVPETDIFRPAAWNAFGMDKEGADFRACKNYGPLYK